MVKYKILFIIITIIILNSCQKDKVKELWIAAGAGYKKPIQEISESFYKKSGIKINKIFGNMQTVSAQVKQSDQIAILIGDKNFLKSKAMGIKFNSYATIGKGILVLAYTKSIKITSISDILNDNIKRISIPDTLKAVYGKAAMELLSSKQYYSKIEDKIIISATVPQVSSYLISGEIDAGFINLTDAIGLKGSIGGYITLKNGYTPIQIVAGTVDGYEKDKSTIEFIDYLSTNECKEILIRFGLL